MSAEFAQELADITQQYETHFAGQSRTSRSLPLLDRLLARLAIVRDGATAEDQSPLREAALERLQIYGREREAIATAQAAGPDFDEAAELATFANQIFGRYHRHFAGQSRTTRDLFLLREIIADLSAIRDGMVRLRDRGRGALVDEDLGLVEQTLTMYQGEVGEVERAQAQGNLEEQASTLGALANGQFQVYRAHFAGQARLGRRPQLLERIIAGLRDLELRMASLRDRALQAEFHDKNQDIVKQNRERYESELALVRQARQEAGLSDLLSHLGDEANESFEAYGQHFAGKDRAQVDLALLGTLCDRLGEIARQMRDLLRAVPSEGGQQNLDVVLSQLAMFDKEWEEVQKRLRPQAQA